MTPKLWPSSLCLSRSPWLLNRSLRVHSPGCWLFLLHRVCVRLQLYCLSSTLLACLCSRLSQFVGLILPSNSHALIWTHLHDYFRYLGAGICHFRFLWNGLCDRAEITVIQFRGHSLPVRQPMRVSWDFFFTSSHFISQFPPTLFPLITAIRMCHFLPVHHPEWHFWPGQKVKT